MSFGNIEELDKKAISFRRRLLNQITETVNNNVSKEIDIICNNYLKVNTIKIYINVRSNHDDSYIDTQVRSLVNPEEVRLTVYFQSVKMSPEYSKDSFYEETSISHIVEIKQNTTIDSHGWFEGENIGLSQIKLGLHQESLTFIPKIVEDILLDIALFHLLKSKISKNNITNIDLSGFKIDYARLKNIKSIYGFINVGAKYFSFASAVRGDIVSFDTKKYVNIWLDFIDYLNFKITNKKTTITSINEIDTNTVYKRDFESVVNVLKKHYRFKQLPKKIIEDILHLENGEYTIINLKKSSVKRPLSTKKLIESLFGFRDSYGKFLIRKSDKLKVPERIDFIVYKFYFNIKFD